jgi:hypothetical protein
MDLDEEDIVVSVALVERDEAPAADRDEALVEPPEEE